MGDKTKEVGGGQAKHAAADFTNFMSEGLRTGNFGGYTTPGSKPGQPAGLQSISATQGFAGTLNNLLAGNVGDPLGMTQYFQGQMGQGGVNNLPSLNWNAPQFQMGNYNPGVGVGSVQSTYQGPAWMQTALQGMQNADSNAPGQRLATNLDSEFATGVRGILQRQSDKNVADLRARYGIGSSGLGSNAQFAEGNYRAEALPQIAAAMGQINQQEQGIDLANRELLSQHYLNALGLNNQSTLGLNSQQLQQGLAQNQFNMGNEQNRAGMALDAAKANQAAQLQAAIASKNNMMQLLGMQNQFAMQNAQGQFGADSQNIANMMGNQQMMNQYNLGLGNLGLGMQQNQLQAQQAAMGQIFNSMNQINQLGTPQAQIVQQPGMFSQIGGLINGGLNLFNSGRNAGIWGNQGGGTPVSSAPNFQMPAYQPPQFGNPQYSPSWG